MDAPRREMTSLGAIILSGGRATRLQGIDKTALVLGGARLVDRVLAAVRAAGAASVVVVGAGDPALTGTTVVREDPPFGGPAAAIIAALRAIDHATDPEWMLVLAADLARPDAAVARIVADLDLLPSDTDGICLADSTSRPQWLTGAYRTAALRRAAAATPDAGRDAAVRALLDDLSIAVFRVPDDIVHDIDTWQDLEQARETYGAVADGADDPAPPAAAGAASTEAAHRREGDIA